jgi:hypothetical protein
MTRLLRSGAAALIAAALAVVVMQAPAHALTPTVIVKLGAKAHLSADGKTAQVKVTVTCNNALPGPIHVDVSQNRGSVTATGSGVSGTGYKCNGRSQRGVTTVKVTPGQHFHKGGASATASVTVGDSGNGTASGNDNRDIQLS